MIFVTCEHLTPDLVWRPEWEDHPNGARRVSNLLIVHPAPQDLGATFCRLFGSGTVHVDDSGVVLSLGPKTGSQDTITILTPEAFAARYPSAEIPVDLSRGWFAGATFDVTSLDRVESALLAGTSPSTGHLPEPLPWCQPLPAPCWSSGKPEVGSFQQDHEHGIAQVAGVDCDFLRMVAAS